MQHDAQGLRAQALQQRRAAVFRNPEAVIANLLLVIVLHAHHIRFRSAGGADALSNHTTLCAWHRLRGVHAGIVRCRGEAPERLEFELGVRGRGGHR